MPGYFQLFLWNRKNWLQIPDGSKIVWQPNGSKSELTALPESLLRED
jgi:hypothetical protein